MSAVDVLAVLRSLMTDAAITRMYDHDAEAKHAAAEKALAEVAGLIEANRKIVAEWGYMAKHGHCRPGVLGTGQTFDCWAVDLCEAALDRVGGEA